MGSNGIPDKGSGVKRCESPGSGQPASFLQAREPVTSMARPPASALLSVPVPQTHTVRGPQFGSVPGDPLANMGDACLELMGVEQEGKALELLGWGIHVTSQALEGTPVVGRVPRLT